MKRWHASLGWRSYRSTAELIPLDLWFIIITVRRRGYRTRKKQKQSRLYLLFILLILLGLYKWGFSFFINIIASTGSKRAQTAEEKDIIPPQRPILAATPEATNSANLIISGYTEAGVEVYYYVNGEQILFETSGNDGSFDTLAVLKEGDNAISVKAKDAEGNESESETRLVALDMEAPEITIAAPNDGQEFFGKQEEMVSITGSVSETEANFTINNIFVRLSNGEFSYALKLSQGENEIKFVAKDMAGNESEKTIKVTFIR